MNPLKNLRVGIKLYVSFALVVGIFTLVAFLQIRSMAALEGLQGQGVDRFKSEKKAMEMDSRLEHMASITGNAIINRNVEESEKEFREAAAQAEKDMKDLAGLADTAEEKAQAAEFAKAYREYLDIVGKELLPYLKSGGEDRKKISELDARMDAVADRVMAQLDKFIESTEAEAERADKEFDAIASASVHTAYTLSGIGVLAAALIAGLITLGIAGPLRKASAFAREVAAGRIDRELAIDQRDEVGQACAALKDIVAALRAVMAEFGEATRQIGVGRLRARGDAGRFSGAFQELIADANRMADSLVGYLDLVPNPLMTVDTQYTIQFMNQAGAKFGGADPVRLQGSRCYEHFKTGDCQTPGCACNKAMQVGGGADSATSAHPGGADLEIVYSAVPIRDREGRTVGAMEVITDQTAIKRAQKKMQRLAQQAEGIANNVSSAAEELSAQVEQSSRGAEMQRERAAETATAMEEMNSTVMEVARNASDAAKAADSTQTKAREGARNVDALVAAVQAIKEQMDSLSGNMAGLGKQAEGISGILNVISDIADQTNLLALNAAIEAARAGDAGRGFAVVADEVRKLAEKTQTATADVARSIAAVQGSVKKSAANAQATLEAISESTGQVQRSGAILREITAMVDQTADQVRAIATASEEQSSASAEISQTTEDVSRIASETAEAMNQSAMAVSDLARLALELNTIVAEISG